MRKLFLALALFATASTASAQDWPQFLGPTGDSKSTQTNLLREWPAAGPEVVWTTDVGIGYGGPVVQNGKVYLLDRNHETEEEIMRSFDLKTGKELWSYKYSAPGKVQYPGSRSVSTVDGKYVYSVGHSGHFYCFEAETGKPVWNKNIWSEHGGTKLPVWAISQCPLIYGDLVIVSSLAPNAGLLAYNKVTGDLKWKTENLGPESYTSPTIVKVDGEDHLSIVISSTNSFMYPQAPVVKGSAIGLNPNTGEVLWRYDNWQCMISCAPLTEAGDNKFLIVGGYERGSTMFQVIKGADGKFSTKELFIQNEFGDQTKPALFIDGHFYAQYGTNNRRDGLCCMDMNGKVLWKTKRQPNFDKGSMIYADGLLLATDGANALYLIDPSPEGYKQLAKADLLKSDIATEGRGNWAPLALADGLLLIRNHSKMMCVKVTE